MSAHVKTKLEEIHSLTQAVNGHRPFLHVQVGSEDRPATTQDMKDIEELVKKLDCLQDQNVFVTHHNVHVRWVE